MVYCISFQESSSTAIVIFELYREELMKYKYIITGNYWKATK